MRLKLIVDDLAAFAKDYRELIDAFTRDGSDFQKKLERFLAGDEPTADDGRLALLKVGGDIVGWARSERWQEHTGAEWDTLEAFVHPNARGSGYAALAASALAAVSLRGAPVAVFSPAMMFVALRAGLRPQLFLLQSVERWERAE